MNRLLAIEHRKAADQIITGVAFTAMSTTLWALTHRFVELQRDGNLYAFQALARIYPALNADVYLAFNSQDRYTVFSPIYAFFIRHAELESAGLTLFLACTASYFCAAYVASRNYFGVTIAWMTVSALIIVPGHYGAYEVFNYSEDYLTARSMAVAMVVCALALHSAGHRIWGVITAAVAMLIHPIMALPGLLLLVSLNLPSLVCISAAASACLVVLGLACFATIDVPLSRYLPLMDAAWLEVVQERSQFLFLSLWRSTDWELTVRPLVSLTLTALVTIDARIRKLCINTAVIAVTGLAIAYISGSIGPVAIFVQGQVWRWTWLAGFLSVFLLAPTLIAVWHDSKCGPLVAILLALGWVWNEPRADSLSLIDFALFLWLIKGQISNEYSRAMRRMAVAAALCVLAWTLSTWWIHVQFKPSEQAFEPVELLRTREILLPGILAAITAVFFAILLPRVSSIATKSAIAAALTFAVIATVPAALTQPPMSRGSRQEMAEFADWRKKIPDDSNVLVVPLPTNAIFAWVTLNRPSYISIDQSSGVVFARSTAMEIRRRSEVLLPIADFDWKIMTRIKMRKDGKQTTETKPKALTAQGLVSACADPLLGFVVAKENVGYAPMSHDQPGPWKDWNLYDCTHVRVYPRGV